jgi:pyruvate dehydrogenase E2 component (dihydrolipoamide acetyltransferase)
MADFTMPSLGADMDEGTVLEWLVTPGQTVHKGDIVAVVDTAKAAVEVEIFTEGVIGELIVPVGTTVPVGAVLATLLPVDTPAPVQVSATPKPMAPPVHSPLIRRLADDLHVDLATVAGTGTGGRVTRADVRRAAPVPSSSAPTRVQATPYARRLCAELGIDIAALSPADGATVRASDVRAATPATAPAAAQTPAPPARADRQPLMREAIAKLMSRSKREIPHYYLQTTVDLTRALAWMRERNQDLPLAARIVPAALMLKATALAARTHPQLNGFWVDDEFRPGPGIHLGVAVSLRGGGLVTPALHDADRLTVDEVMAGLRDLVARARQGRLRGAELTDPTLTVTNLGEQGVESVYGVIYPPQVALVGIGRVVDRPWAVDGLLGVRPLTTVTLSADHRATDGFTGGRFLATLDERLQQPEEL